MVLLAFLFEFGQKQVFSFRFFSEYSLAERADIFNGIKRLGIKFTDDIEYVPNIFSFDNSKNNFYRPHGAFGVYVGYSVTFAFEALHQIRRLFLRDYSDDDCADGHSLFYIYADIIAHGKTAGISYVINDVRQ